MYWLYHIWCILILIYIFNYISLENFILILFELFEKLKFKCILQISPIFHVDYHDQSNTVIKMLPVIEVPNQIQ